MRSFASSLACFSCVAYLSATSLPALAAPPAAPSASASSTGHRVWQIGLGVGETVLGAIGLGVGYTLETAAFVVAEMSGVMVQCWIFPMIIPALAGWLVYYGAWWLNYGSFSLWDHGTANLHGTQAGRNDPTRVMNPDPTFGPCRVDPDCSGSSRGMGGGVTR